MRVLVPLTLALFMELTAMTSAQSPRPKSADPVIIAIDAAVQSLRDRPNQFAVSVTVTGMSVTNSGSGTGMKIEARGGGPGSQTTGLNVTVDGTQMQIAQRNADQALRQQSETATKLLLEIRDKLNAPAPDKPGITSRLTELGKTYVAPVLTSVLGAMIKQKLGLP